jgi:hypothetical protein
MSRSSSRNRLIRTDPDGPEKGLFVMGDWHSDLDPRAVLGAVLFALVSGIPKAFGEVLFGELTLRLKEKVR